MIIRKSEPVGEQGALVLQLNSRLLIGLLVVQLAVGGLAAIGIVALISHSHSVAAAARDMAAYDLTAPADPQNVGPWGELITRDIELEQPEEYALYANTNLTECWTFEGMNPGQVRTLMLSCGVPADQISRALSPPMFSYGTSGTVIAADDALVMSVSPLARAKLYGELGRYAENPLMRFPICFRKGTFEPWFADGQVDKETLGTVRKLLYKRGDFDCFSDLDAVLRGLPSNVERTRLTRALSHQQAVLVALRIRPDTDIDKLLGYWDSPPGVRLIDIRPLLESLKRLTNGGGASILYFLPQFARQRLYTYPLPSQPGDPAIDCHWSTMNFFNETPDNRFANPAYVSSYLKENYYQIASPRAYGDVIMIVDGHNTALHSAVYLAGDVVFTKNGNNFRQPWMLMRLKDLEAMYESDHQAHMLVFRNKSW